MQIMFHLIHRFIQCWAGRLGANDVVPMRNLCEKKLTMPLPAESISPLGTLMDKTET